MSCYGNKWPVVTVQTQTQSASLHTESGSNDLARTEKHTHFCLQASDLFSDSSCAYAEIQLEDFTWGVKTVLLFSLIF